MFFTTSSPSKCLIALAAGVFIMAAPFHVHAAQNDAPRFNVSTEAVGKADVDGGGKYSQTNTDVTVGYKWFTLIYQRSDYSWSDTHNMAFAKQSGTPWDTLHHLALDADFNDQINESIGWFAGGTLISGFEDELKDSFSLLGRGGLFFNVSPEWRLRFGAIGVLSPVHPLFVPLVQIDWRNEADRGLSASIGMPESNVRYRFNDMVSTRISGKWSRDLYRLANDSSVQHKGYVEESGFTTGAYMDITPIAGLTLTAGAEVLAGRDIRIYDHDGDRVSKQDVDPSLGGVLKLRYSF